MSIHRNHFIWGWIFFLAFIVYGSLTPFQFSAQPFGLQAAAHHFLTNFQYRPEILRNVLFYLPFGFYTAALLLQKRTSVSMAASVSILLSLAISALLEILQAFSPARDSTINDCILNAAGGGAGAFLAAAFFRPAYFYSHKTWNYLIRQRPLLFIAAVYAVVILMGGLLPLDICINARYVIASWKAIRWIPFSVHGITMFDAFHIFKDFLVFGSFSFFLHSALSFYSIRRAALKSIFYTAALSLLIETLQIFILSRMTDMTDVAVAVLAAFCAVPAAFCLNRRAGFQKRPVLLAFLCLIWAACLLFLPAPYETVWISKISRLRMMTYFQAYPMFFKIQKLLLTALVFMPLSAFFYAVVNHIPRGRRTAFLFSLFFIISASLYQMMQGHHSLGAAMLAFGVFGASLGILLAARLERIHPQIL